jgi:hypothetical protein
MGHHHESKGLVVAMEKSQVRSVVVLATDPEKVSLLTGFIPRLCHGLVCWIRGWDRPQASTTRLPRSKRPCLDCSREYASSKTRAN